MQIVQQMLILFILMMVGFFCYKKKMITDETSKKISGLIINVTNPAMILSAGLSDNSIAGGELWSTFLLAICLYAVIMAGSMLVPMILMVDKSKVGVYRVMTIFSNIGFMGFPIISSLFGKGALLYASLFMIPYNILIYTYGIYAMKTDEKEGSRFEGKKIMNAGVISCLIAIVLYIGRIPMPEFIVESLNYLSNLTAPLSMMVIGASLAVINLKELVSDVRLLCFSAIKLLIIPILGTLIVKQLVSNEIIVGVFMVMLATPVGSMTAMLAREYDGDYELASKGVALTTLLSVITLPIVAGIVL